MPRNTGDFISGAYKRGDDLSDDTIEYVVGTGENKLGTQSGVTASMRKPRTRYEDYESSGYSPAGWVNDVAQGETIPMFKVKHRPPIVDYLAATKDVAASQAIPLLAHIVKESERRFGERPRASENLSSFSSPLINHAISSGIIPGVEGKAPGELHNLEQDSSNEMNWGSSLEKLHHIKQNYGPEINRLDTEKSWTGWTKANPELMKSDKESILAEMKASRTANQGDSLKSRGGIGPQFEQLPLPFKQ